MHLQLPQFIYFVFLKTHFMFELPVVVLEFPEMHLQPHSPRWNEVEAMENHS